MHMQARGLGTMPSSQREDFEELFVVHPEEARGA
jgi:hypothetical protein